MEVKSGYKQTEAGMIPKDWELKSLSEIGHIKTGPFGTSLKAEEYYATEGAHLVSVRDIGEGTLHFDEKTPLVPPHVVRRMPDYVLNFGDIVFGRKGGVERSAMVRESESGCFLGSDGIRIRPSKSCHPAFIACQLQRKEIQSWLLQNASGTTMPSMNQEILRRINLPFPPLPEQRAVAGALSDVDALLGSLDQLIAKKRDLKQAAMQQLLTGQTRLHGFHTKWELKQLGELAEIISGGTPKTGEPSYWNGSIRWCTPTDITGCSGKYLIETERTISADGLARCSAQLLPVGALLLCSRATIGEIRIAGCEICTNQGFKSLVCKLGVSNEFLYYMLLTMKSQIVERAIGSTFLEISKKDTATLTLDVPEYVEQTAIAEVLSDMDAELAALEQRCAKTRALKQGMMQELLTGKTRLL